MYLIDTFCDVATGLNKNVGIKKYSILKYLLYEGILIVLILKVKYLDPSSITDLFLPVISICLNAFYF